MKDVSDYLWRMASAIFLCPIAAAFWLAFAASSFSPGNFLQFIGSLGQSYAAMDAEGRVTVILQTLFSWAILAFVFLLISFAVNPPRFNYILTQKNGKKTVSVVE